MNLIIVESPTKSRTLKIFLGKEYQVVATMGHIRDLPKSELGIDVEQNFKPKYVIPLKARKTIGLLKKAAERADLIILATDEDREGEAIAWHIAQALNLDEQNIQRIVFHEITKQAIEEAIKNPRKIDFELVDAQQARRVLDRIVGYKLSPFLWKKVARRLSAGRVQSATVKLICDREKEIENFIPQEHWSIEAEFQKTEQKTEDGKRETESENLKFKALLVKKNEEEISKLDMGGIVLVSSAFAQQGKQSCSSSARLIIKNQKEADEIIKDLKGAKYNIIDIEKKENKKNSKPPFTTSSLQQESWQKFHWPAKFTMGTAQSLYENGFITYHRTDSLNLSEQAVSAAKNFIETNYGKNYGVNVPRRFKTKSKGAQEAHEAIRPTRVDFAPQNLGGQTNFKTKNEEKLYDLIWRRFIASQMSQAIFDSTKIDISANAKYTFRANGQILKFDGFLKIYPIKFEETELPDLKKDEDLDLIKLIPSQHFTEPPARYTEASLIKALEENSIGRPSTYAPILSTIQGRNYVGKNEDKRFQPTEIGITVNELLTIHFPKIVDVKFTAEMEEKLDKIAQGKEKWIAVIREFYEPFEENLQKKYQEVSKREVAEEVTEQICPKCGANLLVKLGKFGKFYACPNFPKCKFTKSLKKAELNIKCPKCGAGQMTEKRSKKRGKIFYGCDQYPNCDFALWDKPINDFCPKCNSILIQTKRKQVKCSSKECDFKSPAKIGGQREEIKIE